MSTEAQAQSEFSGGVLATPTRGGLKYGVRRFVRIEPIGTAAVFVLVFIVLAVLFGPILLTSDATTIDFSTKFLTPGSSGHLLGTDQLGRDLLARVLYGGRVSLATALGALAIGVGSGSMLGMIAGFFNNWATQILQRFMDGLMSLPPLILALAIASALGNSSVNVLIAICIVMLPSIFRLVRSATLAIRNQDYVLAASALGASSGHTIISHIIPNIFGTIVTIASIWVGNVIIIEASLGFLGIGIQPPNPSWGNMLSGEGRSFMERAPWIAIVPGLMISITVLASNMLGDGLRTFLDPKSRRFG